MMNMLTVVDDIQIALKETPNLGLGVHLVLTAGKSLLPAKQIPALVQPNGSFLSLAELTFRCATFPITEVKAEWRTQIEKFITSAGKKPTHLDSHHHSSYFTPSMLEAMLELAQEYDCAIRLPIAEGEDGSFAGLPEELLSPVTQYAPGLLEKFQPRRPDAFFASFYDDAATKDELIKIVSSLSDGVYEIMCHPGYSDADLIAGSGYAIQRDMELDVLTDPDVLDFIQKREVALISFAQL
jgi:predicted glycoside hydrolase/deacetylase ChbG (UPF0249 family)